MARGRAETVNAIVANGIVQSQAVSTVASQSLFSQEWQLDRGAATPAYVQIEDRLRGLIESGQLGAGDRIPSERELAGLVGVSRLTARAALSALARQGLLERAAGRRGTSVSQRRLVHDLARFGGFTEIASRQGRAATARICAINESPAPEDVAAELALAAGALVYRIERVRLADGEPVTLEDSWVPVERFPALLEHDMRGSLYRLMREHYGRGPVRATERLEPVLADAEQAHALGITAGAPLMLVERVAYDADDHPVEFARDRHRGDRARFVVELSASGALSP